MCVRLCTQRWNCESETLWRGWGKPPSFTSVSCVSLVKGITFQHCVYLTFILKHGKKWRFGVGAAVGRV